MPQGYHDTLRVNFKGNTEGYLCPRYFEHGTQISMIYSEITESKRLEILGNLIFNEDVGVLTLCNR